MTYVCQVASCNKPLTGVAHKALTGVDLPVDMDRSKEIWDLILCEEHYLEINDMIDRWIEGTQSESVDRSKENG